MLSKIIWSIATVFMLVALASCDSQNSVEDKDNADPNAAWREFCETRNCDQYPFGYLTATTSVGTFYFPLEDTGLHRWTAEGYNIVYVVSRLGRSYTQYDESGRHLRRVSPSDGAHSMHIYPCCIQFLEPFGLNSPETAGMPDPSSVEVDLPSDRWKPVGAQYYDIKITSREALRTYGLEAFNDDFWLLYDEGMIQMDSSGKHRRKMRLISRHPLMFGHHVEVECWVACYATTLDFEDDPDNAGPGVRVGGLVFRPHGPKFCTTSDENSECARSTAAYESLPAELKRVERMIDQLRVPPSR